MSDAHAGHDAHEAAGFTPNQKSVALAVFVIAALLATGFYFVKRGELLAKHPVAGHPGGVVAEVVPTPKDRREAREARGEEKVYPPGQLGARMRFAGGLERRFQRRGRQLTIQATGKDATVFQVTYPAAAADQKHIDQLQRAEGLQRDLRNRGFSKLSIRVGEREVFGKEL